MKKFISLLLSLTLLVSLSASVFADFTSSPTQTEVTVDGKNPEDPGRAEETVWIYRTTESGLIQMRLWSITYGYWLTDWITIGHVIDP